MDNVSDGFLLTTASIAATLVGLLLLGGFFYLETGAAEARSIGSPGQDLVRATIKFTLMLYCFVLVISLGLVVLRPVWMATVFVVVGAGALATLVEWTRRYRRLRRLVAIPRESTWLAWLVTVLLLVLPWLIDGLTPGREAMAWSLLLAGALALQSTAGLLLTMFDLAELEGVARQTGGDSPRATDGGAAEDRAPVATGWSRTEHGRVRRLLRPRQPS